MIGHDEGRPGASRRLPSRRPPSRRRATRTTSPPCSSAAPCPGGARPAWTQVSVACLAHCSRRWWRRGGDVVGSVPMAELTLYFWASAVLRRLYIALEAACFACPHTSRIRRSVSMDRLIKRASADEVRGDTRGRRHGAATQLLPDRDKNRAGGHMGDVSVTGSSCYHPFTRTLWHMDLRRSAAPRPTPQPQATPPPPLR